MVRKIFLLRHGQATYPDLVMEDFERPLTSQGVQKINDLGTKLVEKNILPNLIYCSPSLRTQQTLGQLTLASKLECDVEMVEEMYEASVNTLFKLLTESESLVEAVMLIAHNPGLTYLAEYLTGEDVGAIDPGDLLILEFAVGGWETLAQGTCSFYRV